MKNSFDFGEYDTNQLEKARIILLNVYEYNFGNPHLRSEVARLGTIINKLDYLLYAKNRKEGQK